MQPAVAQRSERIKSPRSRRTGRVKKGSRGHTSAEDLRLGTNWHQKIRRRSWNTSELLFLNGGPSFLRHPNAGLDSCFRLLTAEQQDVAHQTKEEREWFLCCPRLTSQGMRDCERAGSLTRVPLFPQRNIKGLQIAQEAAKPGATLNKPNGASKAGSSSAASDSSSPSMPSSALSTSSSSLVNNNNSNNKVNKLSEHLSTLELGIEFKLDLRPEDLELVRELGAGNGGTVSRVKHIPTGAIMAKKVSPRVRPRDACRTECTWPLLAPPHPGLLYNACLSHALSRTES